MTSGLGGDFASLAVHPVGRFVAGLEELLDEVGPAPAWTMSPSELGDALPRLTRLQARLAEVVLRVLREADRQQVGDDVGATNTCAWWAHVTGQRVPVAQGLTKLADALDDGHAPTQEALAAGRVHVDQARAILDAVDALPLEAVGPALATDAERHLIGLADLDGDMRLDPKALRIAGRKVLEVLAPEIAEAHEAAVLEAEERQAAATASFSMRPDGHGSMVGRFKIPVLHGEILAKHLDAIAAPRHQRATRDTSSEEPVSRISRPLRWGRAFMEYVETRDTAGDGSPKAGGVAATVVVTMTMESLLGAERAAALDTGERIPASEARRLACEAGVIPAVLGGQSQVLDLGRKRRFHTEPQRIAMMLRDGGCATVGCDWPPGMCHAHHKTPWSRGGGTSVEDGVMLCPRHHTLAHDRRYQLKADRHGKVTFARRT
ncbi:MAG TPA: DUF222 domain-containing protein [Marmoricola sp.]|nr:DUF222 domain-containing protein [Marmoricola sp.]